MPKLQVAILILLLSCHKKQNSSLLIVNTNSKGDHNIIKYDNKIKQYFIDNKHKFNEIIKIKPGKYILQTNCSQKKININPKEKLIIQAYTINLMPSISHDENNLIPIKCFNKLNKTFKNIYTNNISLFNLKKNIMVGEKYIDFNKYDIRNKKINIKINSIKVNSLENLNINGNYFIDQDNKNIIYQSFNKKIFLLPNKYRVMVNNTSKIIDLKQDQTIDLSYLKINSSVKIDKNKIYDNRFYFLNNNENAIFKFDKIYPLMPGEYKIRLNNSKFNLDIKLNSREIKTIGSKKILIKLICHNKRVKKNIYLFQKNHKDYFLNFYNDQIQQFINPNHLYLQIEGSGNIRKNLKLTDDIYEKIICVDLIPKYLHSQKLQTDLVHIEGIDKYKNIFGRSGDINYNKNTTIILFPGKYKLKSYVSYNNYEDRMPKVLEFEINSPKKIYYDIFLLKK